MSARAFGIFGLFVACSLAILALRDEPLRAVPSLFIAAFVLYVAIMLLRFPERLRPLFSAVPGIFSRSQIIFIMSVPIILIGISFIIAVLAFQYSKNINDFRSSLMLISTLYFYLYKPNRKVRVPT